MKLVTFKNSKSETRLGAFDTQGRIVDLVTASALLSASGRKNDVALPGDMLRLIESGQTGLKAATEAFEFACQVDERGEVTCGKSIWYQPNEVKLMAPLPQPRSFRDFWIFEEHVKAGWKLRGEPVPEAWYEIPTYYKGNALAIIGPDEDLTWPSYTEKLDYELEMGIIIGKKGRDIPVEKGDEYIFGYTIINDWSARDIQRKEMTCRLGPAKGKDFATSMGPCIVTTDEVDPYNLCMTARVNGEVWSDNNSGTVYWKFNQLIAHVSMDETIYPGEMFGSGTVGGGCGLEMDRWLQPGDVVELEIEKIGILRNRVIRKEKPSS